MATIARAADKVLGRRLLLSLHIDIGRTFNIIEWASARVPPTPITSLEGKDKAVAWPAASLERHRKASSKPTAGGLELVLATAVEGFQGGQTHGQNLL